MPSLCIGQKIGQRTVVVPNVEKRYGYSYYSLVECECGKQDIVANNALIGGRANSCKKCTNKHRRVEFEPGTKVGNWTVVNPNELNKNGRWFSRVKCSCGYESVIRNAYLNSGKTNSCEACRAKKVGVLNTSDDPWWSETNFLSLAAKRRNLEFSLTPNHVKNLSLNSCMVCGRAPYMESRSKASKLRGVLRNSIDRINPDCGYTSENCQTLCWDCNRWKGSLSQQEFDKLIERLVEFRSNLNKL